MTDQTVPAGALVVGVGAGPDDMSSALAVAVLRARRAHRALHLLHVLQFPVADPYVDLYDDVVAAGRTTIARARRAATDLAGDDVPVSTELLTTGAVADQLARHAAGASLLVLQHRDLRRLHRLMTGSVVQSVAGRAAVPVLSVPEGWDEEAPRRGVVTVAAQDRADAARLLPVGSAEAERLGCSLVLLHAWWPGPGLHRLPTDEAYRTAREAQEREELAAAAAEERSAHPAVDLRVEVSCRRPAEALLQASRSSDLLVIGRRHHRLPLRSHLGPTARAAVAHSECPVLVVADPSDERTGADRPSVRR